MDRHICLLFLAYSLSWYTITALAPTPRALVAPINRVTSYMGVFPFPTMQYTIEVLQKTPLRSESLLLDIASDVLWVRCGRTNTTFSKTHMRLTCANPLCAKVGGGCRNCTNTRACRRAKYCTMPIQNSIGSSQIPGELSVDRLALYTVKGATAAKPAAARRFMFACAPGNMLSGMARGLVGSAGMSKGSLSLHSQLSTAFRFPNKFALCLPSVAAPGVAFFGSGPYIFKGLKVDVEKRLTYTPLVTVPRWKTHYFINVNALWVDSRPVNTGSVKIQTAAISTTLPYTTLSRPLYRALRDAVVKAARARKIAQVPSVEPFDTCFESSNMTSMVVGPRVPTIDLVLHNNNTVWSIYGSNSMIHVRDNVMCLAFWEAADHYPLPMVIGTHQMANNLVQFDLEKSRLGFSNTLLGVRSSCSGFNFKAKA